MLESKIGELAALGTAVCWTISALFYEVSGKRIGTYSLNLIRLTVGMVIISIIVSITRGMPLPTDAGMYNYFWLALSGVAGLFIGDIFLFKALIKIGTRLTMLIMSSVPVITTIMGWLFLNEKVSNQALAGISITLLGVLIVMFNREKKRVHLSIPKYGIFLAFMGALGQAGGLILSKKGLIGYNHPMAATQIRIIAAIICFALAFFLLKRWPHMQKALADKKAMVMASSGAVFGPALGVSLSLVAVQYTNAGIAATIMALVPVFVIPPSVWIFKEKVKFKEIIGAIIAVFGVSVLFIF
jgi:drug/metabolite transporter (DMT)-like permease